MSEQMAKKKKWEQCTGDEIAWIGLDVDMDIKEIADWLEALALYCGCGFGIGDAFGNSNNSLATWMSNLADKIRKAETRDTPQQAGNNAEMRKTLIDIIEDATSDYEIKDAPVAGAPGERTEYHVVDADWLIETCRAALAKPPRNCDVGKTAETLLEEFITNRRYSSPNQIGMLYEQALPVIKWVLSQFNG